MIRALRLGLLLFACAASAAAEESRPLLPPIESFAEVLERPLFERDRKRHEPVPAVAGPTGPWQLTGIVIRGSDRYALVGGPAGEPRRVRVGDRLDAGVVRRIAADRIVLDAPNGGTSVVKLFAPAAEPTAPASPIAAPARSTRPGAAEPARPRP